MDQRELANLCIDSSTVGFISNIAFIYVVTLMTAVTWTTDTIIAKTKWCLINDAPQKL